MLDPGQEKALKAGDVPNPPAIPEDLGELFRQYTEGRLDFYSSYELLGRACDLYAAEKAEEAAAQFQYLIGMLTAIIDALFNPALWSHLRHCARESGQGQGRVQDIARAVAALKVALAASSDPRSGGPA